MDNIRSESKVDPDYVSYNSALEITKEEDKRENLAKLIKIIEEEYTKELTHRERHIEQIEIQISKVQKVLHLLRYVLVTSYYKKQELEFACDVDEASTSNFPGSPSKQNRIHPAIKKLLGRNFENLDHLNFKGKRKSGARTKTASISLSDKSNSDNSEPQAKKIKLDNNCSSAKPENVSSNKLDFESIRNRKKTKHRIIVGNISKFMSSTEDDNLTHKWMVYVRGPKEHPDVSHIIDKVIFYLHASYKPHDVVEVSEAPFHLSRRGWGEFPVRVQIFFKVTINKPIHVIHNLKLDKTYTGRQTLGNETLIDVFLYDNTQTESTYNSDDNLVQSIKEENIEEYEVSDFDDNVFFSDIVIKEEALEDNSFEDFNIKNDHCYASMEALGIIKKEKHKTIQDESNPLIYGLENYLESDVNNRIRIAANTNNKKDKIILPFNNLNEAFGLNYKEGKINNTKIIVFGKKIEGLLTNFSKLVQIPKNTKNLVLFASKTEQDNFKINVANNRYKNMGEILPFLFKKLPLSSNLANDQNFKRLYPFIAPNLKEFTSWNLGKRRSAEWSRARAIRKIVLQEKIYGAEKWNTKSILMYGRSHIYTPLACFGLFKRESDEKNQILACYSHSDTKKKRFEVKNRLIEENEITVNVDSDIDIASPLKRYKSAVDISDPVLRMECTFVKQCALDVGVMLKNEEIDDGIIFNGAERMIFEAVKALAENLIRRGQNYRICHNKCSSNNTGTISKEDVESAINERPEMNAIIQFRNNRRNMEYFS